MICNLQQNPSKRCVVGHLCPTLLKAGNMFLISRKHQDSPIEERALLGQDGQYSEVICCINFFNCCLDSWSWTPLFVLDLTG